MRPRREKRPEYFALKEITPPNAEERRRIKSIWVNEVRRMKEMNECHNDHIVRCITGFTRGGSWEKRYLLILEWADGGSLEDLYKEKENQNPQLNGELIE
ncbi:hypothetical protein ANO14919_041290 [Xylariales sp. No.14919]|nr:hypothetical protein ANO14919_041290 [Xylariales sp. No.14919]